ncbi:hypothetical protein UFOVP1319_31 [uncultured Caudovirales phage]|uniref:Uncharacterized protein n=1 Tax=uncultured Caudovirales phage TaxID=2100421 RepID=A0A6J5RVT2_9CAUD|nr:hypothetical protein UFOVP478_14 [uncultured Caudovirales phage]CAB4191482.1 hypothetical protein UFOVP1225_41 [uncultured Caudovirales phage]CAB4197738.1 hypothetical protein UFOVP1319_31 [uncultured Caudovirales phage]CAB4217556.1 hypothetical protein UFOVP1591_41 [uncultured Caudovirales phage]
MSIERPSIRSPQFDNCGGKILTDKKIFEYILKGHYGQAAQLRAIAQQAERAQKKPRIRTPSMHKKALDILK